LWSLQWKVVGDVDAAEHQRGVEAAIAARDDQHRAERGRARGAADDVEVLAVRGPVEIDRRR
jgi:hypothetical protein